MVREVVKLLGRPALHAKTLGLRHPVNGEQLQFNSELPEDFDTALMHLRGLS